MSINHPTSATTASGAPTDAAIPSMSNGRTDALADGLALVKAGWAIFPCGANKRPLVRGGQGFHDASTDPAQIEQWVKQWHPPLWGIAVPEGMVVIDQDATTEGFDPKRLVTGATGLYYDTGRAGHHHLWYRTERKAHQRAGWAPGWDTRTAGEGYVIAWDIPVLTRWTVPVLTAQLPPAPAWVYEDAPEPGPDTRLGTNGAQRGSTEPTDGPMTSDDSIVRWLGGQYLEGMTADDLVALQAEAYARGDILSADPKRPWTTADWKRHAAQAIRKWKPIRTLEPMPMPTPEPAWEPERGWVPPGMENVKGHWVSPAELASPPHPVRFAVDGLLPFGFALLAGAPKVGKSLMAYQLSIAVATGQPFLGFDTEKMPVHYAALEDGVNRIKGRLHKLYPDYPSNPIENLTIMDVAPALAGGLEEVIEAWAVAHPEGSLFIIDLLAKVMPNQSGKGSAYNADYDMLNRIQNLPKQYPLCLLILTHDRKAGSDNWVNVFQGTKGTTGSSDHLMLLSKDPSGNVGKLSVSGRDVGSQDYGVTLDDTVWRLATEWEQRAQEHEKATQGRSKDQAILDAIRDNAPISIRALARLLGRDRANVGRRVQVLSEDRLIFSTTEGYELTELGKEVS